MAIKRVEMQNFTVFDKLNIEFCDGINIFVGENGVGKTHIMKLIYAACKATKKEVSFSHKIVRVFGPKDLEIHRLVKRNSTGGTATARVFSDNANINIKFSTKTKKWEAEVTKEIDWEKKMINTESIFIPAKEILSNSYNLINAVLQNNVEFDDTYVDIISAAQVNISQGNDSNEKKKYLDILQKINSGKVTVEKDKFYLKPGTQAKIEFNLVAEGIRKIALLWQLIKNGTLEKGSVLFWDEPEANINPKHIPVIVDILLMLQRSGVQVFVSTHNYFLAKYFDIKSSNEDLIRFHSLYKSNKGEIEVEIAEKFRDLENNIIMDTFLSLYREEIKGVIDFD